MKKILLTCLSIILGWALVQAQNLQQLWYYESTATSTELLNNSSATYSIAYNKVTGKLYVANRGDEIYIINPDTYSGTVTTLPKSGLSKLSKTISGGSISEAYRFSKVRVDDNGVIYATAMQTNGIQYIYRWANETADPTRTEITVSSVRTGDSFGLFGTGDNTYLYSMGSTASIASLYVFKVTGNTPTLYQTIDLTAAKHGSTDNFKDIGSGSISPESVDVLWVKSIQTGVPYKRIHLDLTTGTLTTPFENMSSLTMNANLTGGVFVPENSKGFYFTNGGRALADFNKTQLLGTSNVGDVAATLSTKSSYTFSKSTFTSNSGYGDAAYKRNLDGTTTFYVLNANNYLAALKTDAILPVSLKNFSAVIQNGKSVLSWQTSSEQNNSGFELSRSTDGVNFNKIAFVAAKSPQGANYVYTDNSAIASINYYQLKQINQDGRSTLFDQVVSVNMNLNNAAITAYPNPIDKILTVNLAELGYQDVQLELFDSYGKKILSQIAQSSRTTISLENLSQGIYYLQIMKNGQKQKSIKVVKL